MIIGNNKPIRIIGYSESSMTHEFVNEITKTHAIEIISPSDFLIDSNKQQYQHIISISWDLLERKKIAEYVDNNNLDLITVVHNTVLLGTTPQAIIQPGTFIFPFCNISIGSTIGRHCIVGSYSLIGHYSHVGSNCLVRPGVMINGKSTVGKNCIINTRSTITNNAFITDDVEIMAFTNIFKNITSAGRYYSNTRKN